MLFNFIYFFHLKPTIMQISHLERGPCNNWRKEKKEEEEKTGKDGGVGRPGAVVVSIGSGQQGLSKHILIVFLASSKFWQSSSSWRWRWGAPWHQSCSARCCGRVHLVDAKLTLPSSWEHTLYMQSWFRNRHRHHHLPYVSCASKWEPRAQPGRLADVTFIPGLWWWWSRLWRWLLSW